VTGSEVTQEVLASAVDHLRAGGVVAIATETFFGLCADARRASAIETVFSLKGRESAKACAVMLPATPSPYDHWTTLVRDVPPLARRLADRFWPGPLTIALPAREDVHPLLRYRGTIAVRVPGASPAADLLKAFGGPLTATSANLSGSPSALTDEDVRGYFGGRGGLLIVGGRAPGGMPSTVVEVGATATDGWRVLRAGAVPASVIESAANGA
jgi:L-threonylcarbamoyladenylate synthase